mgnify:CR=1 FL=1
MSFTGDDFFTEDGDFKYEADLEKLPWQDPMLMMMSLVNVKHLVYKYSVLVENTGVFEDITLTADVVSNPQEQELSIDNIFYGYDRYNIREDATLPPNDDYDHILYPDEENTFRLAGSEQITTPAGTFDCAIVEVVTSRDVLKKLWMIIDKPGVYAKIIEENPNIPSEASFAIKNIQSDSFLVNFVCSNMNLSVKEKYEILNTSDLNKRALLCLKQMNVELQRLSLKNDIQSKVRSDLDQQQREYFLHQQLKTIQEELGGNSSEGDIEEMRQKSKGKTWDDKTAEHFEKELRKLQRLNPQMPEFAIQRNYLEFMLDLPFQSKGDASINLKSAQKALDNDHYGLEKIKKRIYKTRQEARSEVFEYIEGFYNPVRRHKHLDQLSPLEFERRQIAL